MMKKVLFMVFVFSWISCLTVSVFAEMGSANYTITRSVLSNGGIEMYSDSFTLIGTLGQASPLEKEPPSWSASFDNYPGFWHAMWDTVTCPRVIDLAARAKSGKVELTWPHVGAESYNIYRSESADGDYVRITEAHVTDYCTYLDTGLIDGTTYYYRVTALCNGSQGGYSNTAEATPQSRIRR